MKTTYGNELHPSDQAHVLRSYVHRSTKEHKPQWAIGARTYYVQFASDAEWLRNTLFCVRNDGRLDRRAKHCESTPTWPDNPELRRNQPVAA